MKKKKIKMKEIEQIKRLNPTKWRLIDHKNRVYIITYILGVLTINKNTETGKFVFDKKIERNIPRSLSLEQLKYYTNNIINWSNENKI